MEQNQLTLGTYEENKGNIIDKVPKTETVIKKSAVKNTLEIPKDKIWNKVNSFIEQCKANKDNYAYLVVEYFNHSNLETTREGLSFNEIVERLFKAESDSYGGMYGNNVIDRVDGFKNAVLDFKSKFTIQPYKKNIQNNIVLTDINADNVKIFVSEKAKEYLTKNGIDVEAVLKEADLIKSRQADSDDWLLEQKFNEIEVGIEKLNGCINSDKNKSSDIGLIKRLDLAIRAKAGIKEEYSRNVPLCPPEYSNKTVEELVKLRLEAQKELQNLKADEECFYKVHRGEITYEQLKKMMLNKMIENSALENQANKEINVQSEKIVFSQEVKAMENNKPIEVIKGENGLQVSIWQNNGRKSAQLTKSYKDKSNEWKKQSITFFDEKGIDNAINLLQQAKEKMQ